MKHKLAVYFGLALAVFVPTLIRAQTVQIVADEEKRGGYLLEVTRQALVSQGYTLSVRYMPWNRALETCILGRQCDMLLGVYRTRERQSLMEFTDPLGKVDLYLFGLTARGIRYSKLEDLASYRIGVVRGARISEAFSHASLPYLEYAADLPQNIRKLLAGHLDLFVDKKRTTLFILHSQFSADETRVTAIEPPLRRDFFYNAVPKGLPYGPQLITDFNRGLYMIKSNGDYAAILARYSHE